MAAWNFVTGAEHLALLGAGHRIIPSTIDRRISVCFDKVFIDRVLSIARLRFNHFGEGSILIISDFLPQMNVISLHLPLLLHTVFYYIAEGTHIVMIKCGYVHVEAFILILSKDTRSLGEDLSTLIIKVPLMRHIR